MNKLVFTATCAVLLTGFVSAQVAGTYTLYGSGCAGSGTKPGGTVLPKGYDTQYANSNNRYPFGSANMHYMQSHDSAELPVTALVRGLNLRNRPNIAQPAYMLTMDIYLGYTNSPPTALNSTFASNWAGTPTKSFSGNLNVPAVAGLNDPTVWTMKIPFAVPFVYSRPRGHFLFECVNTTATVPTFTYFDAVSTTTAQTCRLYATTAAATTGTPGSNYGLIVQLENPGATGAIVNLSNSGVPEIGKTHSINVTGAVANSAAILWLGAQQLNLSLGSALPGCTLYTSLDIILGAASTGLTGSGSLTFTLPSNPSLVGIQYYNQWMVVDAAANALGVVLSGGGAAKIGG